MAHPSVNKRVQRLYRNFSLKFTRLCTIEFTISTVWKKPKIMHPRIPRHTAPGGGGGVSTDNISVGGVGGPFTGGGGGDNTIGAGRTVGGGGGHDSTGGEGGGGGASTGTGGGNGGDVDFCCNKCRPRWPSLFLAAILDESVAIREKSNTVRAITGAEMSTELDASSATLSSFKARCLRNEISYWRCYA